MSKDVPWRKAIEMVLAEANEPMHYKDIADKIVADGLRAESVGATPSATVIVTLTNSINKDGDNSPFIKLGKGQYALRRTPQVPDKSSAKTKSATKIVQPEEDLEEQYEIISSFGMFWRRDLVDWNGSPSLLGMQQLGAEPVNFRDQIGVYLLYDGREVIYVGRATDRPLGRRLYEHTVDRLSTRWDRFSWFGLLPVSDKGNLGPLPSEYMAKKLVPALEAILIEALEPRQNRRRGDDLAAVEYLQKEDPEVERKRRKAIIESALEKF